MIKKVGYTQTEYKNFSDNKNSYQSSLVPRIRVNEISSKQPSFGSIPGMGPAFAKLNPTFWVPALLEKCNSIPMVGVAVIDMLTAILPRTWVDAKTNGFAAAETFRRESSGLVVNCLIPGGFVWMAAKGLELLRPENKGLAGLWANQDSMEALSHEFKEANGNTVGYLKKVIGKMSFNNGKNWNSVDVTKKEIEDAIIDFGKVVDGQLKGNSAKKAQEKLQSLIIKETGGAEHLKYASKDGVKAFSTNLSHLLRDSIDLGKIFKKVGISNLDKWVKNTTKFINQKSIIGLLIVIPLAASMQSINRWITRKRSGKNGAPIYKDFVKENTQKEMNKKEKASFWAQKIGAAGLMVGLAILSMMKKPSLKMLQFNNKLPSMDQCRWIAMSTFASRMLASEDKNELHEVTWRDIATFSSLYFLGDYVAKGVATIIKKVSNINLLNYTKEAPQMTQGKSPLLSKAIFKLKEFGYWVKGTTVKSFDEAAHISPKAKSLRALCEVSSLGFSMLLLGILVPWYVRRQTEIRHAEEQAQKYRKLHAFPDLNVDRPSARRTFQAFGMMGEGTK